MPDRKMFWRIIRRLLTANRGRLLVILLALGAGAAVTAALLNLQIDAKRRIATEFRAFGSNAIIVPRDQPGAAPSSSTLDERILSLAPYKPFGGRVIGIPYLYLVVGISPEGSKNTARAVVAGTYVDRLYYTEPGVKMVSDSLAYSSDRQCYVGTKLAKALNLRPGTTVTVANGNIRENLLVIGVLSSGGPADDQLFASLDVAQRLAGLPGRMSLVQLVIWGTPQEIQSEISALAKKLPGADVRPIRQFTEGEAKIYDRISGILSATVALVLILTALCVMAAMTNVAMERRNDVGLMKAIGGATRRVLRLFLAEAALLGLTGGIIGAALGILLSVWLGKQVFGQPAHPRLIVYPVAVALTIIVAIAGAFPLRRLASIRPAAVFRGEA